MAGQLLGNNKEVLSSAFLSNNHHHLSFVGTRKNNNPENPLKINQNNLFRTKRCATITTIDTCATSPCLACAMFGWNRKHHQTFTPTISPETSNHNHPKNHQKGKIQTSPICKVESPDDIHTQPPTTPTTQSVIEIREEEMR
jgi:hypothetical protein